MERTNNSGILLILDFEKAFDTVEWSFLKTLEEFNFGPQFINWIKLLYQDPVALIKNNGWFSNKVSIKRGIWQGCPVSALLFIMIVEILAIKLKKSTYKGIRVKIGNKVKEMKISQYADDTCLFLKDEVQIEPVLNIINYFGDIAGPKLNLTKTEGLWLGSKTYQQLNCSLGNIKWPTDPIRCLGVFISTNGYNSRKCEDLNWWSKLDKIENHLKLWKMRNLTILGKITVVKHLILPKLSFSCQFFETPITGFVKKFENIVYDFICNSKDKIKQNTLISDIQNGGLEMVDLASKLKAMKASWVYKLKNEDSDWNFLGNEYLNSLGENNLTLYYNFTNSKQFPLISSIPIFYQNMILAYNEAKTIITPDSHLQLLDEVLRGNVLFTCYNGMSRQHETLFQELGVIWYYNSKVSKIY